MPNQTEVTLCPNPKCHKEIEEPILLNVLSATPAEQYQACPHCFFKLDMSAENEEGTKQESGPDSHSSLEKVFDVISTQPKKEISKEEEETKEEEIPAKPSEKEKTKEEEIPAKPSEKEESSSGCNHNFGYLASRPKNDPIPQECLTCQRIVDCMLKLGTT